MSGAARHAAALAAACLAGALLAGAGPVLDDPPPLPPLPIDELDEARLVAVPAGLPAPLAAPADNPFSLEGLRLGRRLFFDPILSADLCVACASCHQPAHGFASPERFPRGALGRRALRNAPTLVNRALGQRHMWDGRFASLERQVLAPIADANEMALPLERALARLRAHAEYPARFAAAYGELSEASLARALATFVRALTLGDSPVDRFRAGSFAALSIEERGGLWIFESKGGCWRCHSGPNFSDEELHATGIGVVEGEPEPGRFAVSGDERDRGRFKTPTLRGVTRSAPYMHDGSLATLADVIAFYRRGGNPNASLDPLLRPLELDEREAALLVAFLGALSRTVGE